MIYDICRCGVMCCSVLQCVAVCCTCWYISVLPCCSVMQCVAVCCSVLHMLIHISAAMLHDTHVDIQSRDTHEYEWVMAHIWRSHVIHISASMLAAVEAVSCGVICCSLLQCVAVRQQKPLPPHDRIFFLSRWTKKINRKNTRMCLVMHMNVNESWHTYEWVMSCISVFAHWLP